MPGDINGFDPFPGRYPAPDFFPGSADQYQTHPDYKDAAGAASFSGSNEYPPDPRSNRAK